MQDAKPTPTTRPNSMDRVSPDTLVAFRDVVARLGGDADAYAAKVGLDLATLDDPECTLGLRQTVDLVALAASEMQCLDFGMRLACAQAGELNSPLLRVVQSARTLGEGWRMITERSFVHSPMVSIWLRAMPDEEAVIIGYDNLMEDCRDRRQVIEQMLLASYLTCRQATGGYIRARRVEFRHFPISKPEVYRRYFGCDVRFGQTRDAIIYADQVLDCPIIAANPQVFHRELEAIDTKAFEQTPLQAAVRGLIIHFLGDERCTNEEIADLLGLHPRTLHRRLEAEKTSFQRIKNGVRREFLMYYLDETDFLMGDISQRLGFAEPSAMTRFCRHHLSASPRERRAQKAGR